jgi:outer membrane lipoprotein-sorting protein
MFDRIQRIFFIAGLLTVTGSLLASEPAEVIAKADRVRTYWEEAVLTVKITAETPGKPVQTGNFNVFVKGRDLSLVWFVGPPEDRKAIVTKGDDIWLLLPKTQNAIKVPKSHRVAGGFSVSDASRVRFSEDYDALLERRDGELDVYRLMAKAGLKLQFPIIRLWIDPKEGLFRKTEFLLSSGRKAKEISFDAFALFGGKQAISRMTIVDVLKPGKTTVEYLKYEKVSLPDSFFDREEVRKRLPLSEDGR